jgi:Site-specific recombinases, DNA invertase Pin homologs
VSDRPELAKLMKKLQSGDSLVVTKLDRVARSVVAGSELIDELNKRGVKVNILNMGIIDNTPTGKLLRNVMLSFAEFERDLIVQRTQEGKEIAKRKPGFREGRPKKFTKKQIEHAMELLNDNSYSQVSEMTGIRVSTLTREKKKYING